MLRISFSPKFEWLTLFFPFSEMKEVIIKIPETRLQFFLELMQQLGFEVSQKYEIPEEHIAIVMDRMAKSEIDSDRLEDWEEVKKNLKFDA